MSVGLGISPIGWSNDDMPELGGATALEACHAEARLAGFEGIELGHKFPAIRRFYARSSNARAVAVADRRVLCHRVVRVEADFAHSPGVVASASANSSSRRPNPRCRCEGFTAMLSS